jgi:ADP-ribosylglycohydrolase
VGEEALAISVYCALVAGDLEAGVVLAVNHGGDSDSTGAITGNLLGLVHGVETIPAEWLDPLELREVITEIADDLLDFPGWPLSEYGGDPDFTARTWKKYPGF